MQMMGNGSVWPCYEERPSDRGILDGDQLRAEYLSVERLSVIHGPIPCLAKIRRRANGPMAYKRAPVLDKTESKQL
jgi:hypothetical protein